jgi:hypothetical protein
MTFSKQLQITENGKNNINNQYEIKSNNNFKVILFSFWSGGGGGGKKLPVPRAGVGNQSHSAFDLVLTALKELYASI